MKREILIILIIGLFSVSIATASSDDLFINHLTDKIYEDCYGKDIQINQPYIINTATNESVDIIKWPYGYQDLRRIVELFGEMEPFAFLAGTCENKGVYISGIDGCRILTCETNKLDINQFTYFWNGVRISVPREEFKTTYGSNSPIVETHGDNSPVNTGDNSPITQQESNIWVDLFLSKGTIAGAILGFVLKILYDIWRKKYSKRKKSSSKKS